MKPTRGRIPQARPMGQTDPLRVWTQFALARDVTDLIALFPLIARDVVRPVASSVNQKRPLHVGLLMHDPIIGLKVADDCVDAVRLLGEAMVALGHRVDVAHPRALDTLFGPFWEAMAIIGPAVRAEQVVWVSTRLGRACGPGDVSDDLLESAERGRLMSAEDVAGAYERVRVAMSAIKEWWESGFDLLATPVMLKPPWKLGDESPQKTGMFCAPFSFTGQPALVVPMLMSEAGLPVGVQLVGRWGDDELLLALGSELQTAVGWLERTPHLA